MKTTELTDKASEILNNQKYKTCFLLAAVLFFAADMYIWGEIARTEEEAKQMETEIREIENFRDREKRKSRLPFFTSLLEGTTAENMIRLFEENGCIVEESAEGREDRGVIAHNIFNIKGKGTFSQILSAFDIIESKEQWTAAELCLMKKEKGKLVFEVNIRSPLYRGTYGKEKYSSHRSYGNGEKPGG